MPLVTYQVPSVNNQVPLVNNQVPLVTNQVPSVNYQVPSVNYKVTTVNYQIINYPNYVPINNYHFPNYPSPYNCQMNAPPMVYGNARPIQIIFNNNNIIHNYHI